MTEKISSGEESKISEILVGRKIVELSNDKIVLDSGMVLYVHGNEGCGGCSEGWYNIMSLPDNSSVIDNVITSASIEYEQSEKNKHNERISLFVFVDGVPNGNEIVAVEGSDNGYYGTGFSLQVEIEKK